MPWVGDVNGIIQAWYSGNEVGNALADVVYGKINPSGRLSLTLPVTERDIPAYLNMRSENGKIHYREDLFVGYKGYQMKGVAPLFPFGYVAEIRCGAECILTMCIGMACRIRLSRSPISISPSQP